MSDTEQTNRRGVNLLEEKVLQAGHIFREQSISDYGIDAQIEVRDGDRSTGRLIAAQIKTGPSYFANENENGFWHYFSEQHQDLWINHSLPVILVLCDLDNRLCYYELVTDEACIRTASGWKILVPKNKIITTDSSHDLISIASPIVAASDYSIHSEQDQSHASARRISLDIVIHSGNKPVSKPFLGAVVRAALKDGQSSQYHRDELSERVSGGRPVDVVWGFVYLRDIDRESASWVCRFQWISPSLEESSRPSILEGEEDGSGLVIDWRGNLELAKFFDERRASKADFLKHVDQLLAQLPDIQAALDSILEFGERSPHAIGFTVLAEKFESMWDGNFTAPNECQRLDQAIQELLAAVGNAGLIWTQRNSRHPRQLNSLMSRYRDTLIKLNTDLRFLRADVR